MIRLFAEAFRNLAGNKQRSLLALLGIVIGTGSVIAMVNIGAIVRSEALRQFEAMGTDLVTLSIRADSEEQGFSVEQISSLPARVPGIAIAAPYGTRGDQFSVGGRQPVFGTMVGATPDLLRALRLNLSEGRPLSTFDGAELFVIAGVELVKQWLKAGAAVGPGDQIQTNDGTILTVVGLLEGAAINPLVPIDMNRALLLSAPALARIAPEASLTGAVLRTAEGSDARAGARQAEEFLRTSMPGRTIQARSAEQIIEQMANQMRLYTMLLGAIGGISLVVGGVGVMNVMLVTVTERRREIGIRMAIGARRGSIVAMFLAEALCLSLTGGFIGTVVGIATAYGAAQLANWTFILSPLAIPLGAGVSGVVGVVFGYLPARQASRVDPIEALRYE